MELEQEGREGGRQKPEAGERSEGGEVETEQVM